MAEIVKHRYDWKAFTIASQLIKIHKNSTGFSASPYLRRPFIPPGRENGHGGLPFQAKNETRIVLPIHISSKQAKRTIV
jgi:hypothetical protein